MTSDLVQDMWSRYGFKGNPFDTAALSASVGALLPVSKAIVGRERDSTESTMLTGIMRSPGGARAVVEGDVGVGKTTFVNYHRYLWEVEATHKLLTPSTEISITDTQSVPVFVGNIVGSVLARIILQTGTEYVHDRPLLHELFLLNRAFTTRSMEAQVSLLGFGGGIGKSTETSVSEPSEVQLIEHLKNLVDEVKQIGFSGIFLHFDNMELASMRNPEGTREFFNRIRDVLQIPDIYYIFVGPRGFFNDIISPEERVRSVFSGFPIQLKPLTEEQVLGALEKRYEILSAPDGRFIRPVDRTLVTFLYNLYDGKLRFILDAISSIVVNLPHIGAETLDFKLAKEFLAELVIAKLRGELTAKECEILWTAVKMGTFTNAHIAKKLKQQRQNVNKYFNTLLNKQYIYPHHRDGRQVYYCAREDVRILGDVPDKVLKKVFRL